MQTCPNCGEENPPKFRLCGFCGAQLAPALPPQEVRKTVTIVFSDLKGSTNLGEALDSESLREVMNRYFEEMSRELERHGGTIEKFIGDAVMAVFGLPTLHEDDALRAVKAAAGMQRALAELNVELQRRWGVELTNRTGVNTGEVVAGDPTTGQRLITGDPVNTAARLEQAAPANEILIGQLTYNLVRDAVEVEAVEPLALKGKAEPVPAYRLIAVRDAVEGRARHDDAPMVGREAEMTRLRSQFDESVAESGCRMATVIGEAGVGKSRLIREFVASVEGSASVEGGASVEGSARVVRGRCLPYGEGITFWPFVEIARSAAEIRDEDPPDVARTKLLTLVGERDVAVRIASAAGLTPAQFPVAELFWGARRFMEILAGSGPLVVVIDDIHWAEPTFLELLEHLLDNVGEAPVLLLCSSRHDLLEEHPDWSERPRATRLVLEPLSEGDAAQVVENLLGNAGLPEEVRARIVAAAEGNPLFVEQMLSMLIDTGALRFHEDRWIRADESEEIAVPPTIQALLASRLDRLDREERAVIEPASVIGLSFAEPAVAALAPDPVRPQVPAHLGSLTRKQLIRPDTAETGADETYRFHHILVRDAAYHGLLKRARATMHERFVAWADRVNADRDRELEFEEILGYHLEQAYRYRNELGPLDEEGIRVGIDGARRLSGAGRRAFARGDMHAAANLFRRAAALLQGHDPVRLALLPDLGEALMELGEFSEAEIVLDEAIAAADEIWDDRLRAHAALIRLLVSFYAGDEEGWTKRVHDETEAAIAIFGRDDDHAGLAKAWRLRFGVQANADRYAQALDAAEQVVEQARLAGDSRLAARGATGYALAALCGPMPVPEAIARCERLVQDVTEDRRTEGIIRCFLAQLYAMNGEFERARETYGLARRTLEELGRSVLGASTSINSWRVEMLAGDPARAVEELRRDFVALEEMGEKYLRSTVAGSLAQALYVIDDLDEAERYSTIAEELAGEDDVESQALWRCVRAKVMARRGEIGPAEGLVRRALEIVRPTEAPIILTDTLLDLAAVLRLSGRARESGPPLEEALTIYEAKKDIVSVERVRSLLEEVLGSTSTAG